MEFKALCESIRNEKRLSLHDFEVAQTLGIGTFGKVKQVFYKKDSKKIPLAMKMLKKKEIVKLSQVDHIKCENQILK